MEMYMKESGKTGGHMVLESTGTQMEVNILDSGKRTQCTVMANKHGKTELTSGVALKKGRSNMEHKFFQTELHT